jgi:uncharacterized membrane protein YkvA (DUF1232 family)
MTPAELSRYVRTPQVAGWKKLFALAAAFYVVLPVDLIPDVIPVIGWLDDLGVVGVALYLIARDVRRVAQNTPAR